MLKFYWIVLSFDQVASWFYEFDCVKSNKNIFASFRHEEFNHF